MTLYSTDCPRCRVLQMKLNELNLGYTVKTDIADMQALGITTAPVLEVDGELFAFNKALAYLAKLH